MLRTDSSLRSSSPSSSSSPDSADSSDSSASDSLLDGGRVPGSPATRTQHRVSIARRPRHRAQMRRTEAPASKLDVVAIVCNGRRLHPPPLSLNDGGAVSAVSVGIQKLLHAKCPHVQFTKCPAQTHTQPPTHPPTHPPRLTHTHTHAHAQTSFSRRNSGPHPNSSMTCAASS
jgi:hypothetical protein